MTAFTKVENNPKESYGDVKPIIVKEFIRRRSTVGGILILGFEILLPSSSVRTTKYFQKNEVYREGQG